MSELVRAVIAAIDEVVVNEGVSASKVVKILENAAFRESKNEYGEGINRILQATMISRIDWSQAIPPRRISELYISKKFENEYSYFKKIEDVLINKSLKDSINGEFQFISIRYHDSIESLYYICMPEHAGRATIEHLFMYAERDELHGSLVFARDTSGTTALYRRGWARSRFEAMSQQCLIYIPPRIHAKPGLPCFVAFRCWDSSPY